MARKAGALLIGFLIQDKLQQKRSRLRQLFARRLALSIRTPNVANHVKNFWCGVHGFQVDVRMCIMKDPKDFICESLPNHFYACEIKHSNLELADPREHSFRL